MVRAPFASTIRTAAPAALVLLAATTSQAAVQVASDGNTRGAIWSSPTVELVVDPSFDRHPAAESALTGALTAWAESAPDFPLIQITHAVADRLGYAPGSPPRNTLRFAWEGEPLAKGALGITLVSFDDQTGELIDADIVLNGVYRFADIASLRGVRGDERSDGAYDLQSVLTHELGHWFGLGEDPDDPQATMYPSTAPGQTNKRYPDASDQLAALALYGQSSADESAAPSCRLARLDRRGPFATLTAMMTLILLGAARRPQSRRRTAPTDHRGLGEP